MVGRAILSPEASDVQILGLQFKLHSHFRMLKADFGVPCIFLSLFSMGLSWENFLFRLSTIHFALVIGLLRINWWTILGAAISKIFFHFQKHKGRFVNPGQRLTKFFIPLKWGRVESHSRRTLVLHVRQYCWRMSFSGNIMKTYILQNLNKPLLFILL